MKAPVHLTFLAPADRCNQRCPACYLTEVSREPVDRSALSPEDYARFVEQFVEAGVPVLATGFQGYEVTLPQSWPYVEAVFKIADAHGVHKSFITNGMLLHKRAASIRSFKPFRITVSLDGATADINDPLRGLDGAFHATMRSVRCFLESAPEFRERLVVSSCLHTERNAASLVAMPRLLAECGLRRWNVSFALHAIDGQVQPVASRSTLRRWLQRLEDAAKDAEVKFHVVDEFAYLQVTSTEAETSIRQLREPSFFYRMDPLGYVRVGTEALEVFDPSAGRRWYPDGRSALEVVGYTAAVWNRGQHAAAVRS